MRVKAAGRSRRVGSLAAFFIHVPDSATGSLVPRPPRTTRQQLMQALDDAVCKVGAQSVLISDLMASLVGLNSTDLECLDLLHAAGASTAGRLATHTGLTSGATTAVIDRLERAGFVKRRRDPGDRRVVVIEAQPHRTSLMEPLYAPLVKALAAVHRGYDERQLAAFVEYLSRLLDAGAAHVTWLRAQPAVTRARRRHASQRTAFKPAAAASRPPGAGTVARPNASAASSQGAAGAKAASRPAGPREASQGKKPARRTAAPGHEPARGREARRGRDTTSGRKVP
jgi:DNA-binding MarR family transcriptional regulator